ncbi:hypothetical protein P3W24_00495 [Luteibacter sp. PPL201]|uniref:DUF4136 domain-containing protein n=1 Tax=Luteibacter sahnii TaxID=3021977 RepID=A0ABT6B5Q3_9GAMM|nr:hypothetical protein [Luteibacter sp. PPL193]MDY1548616.1 hypothetical protein [Luteibacter sp. PPL193]
MRRLALPALVLLLAALSGCATDKRNEALNTTLMRYASAIRWGDFVTAQAFVDPTYAEAHPMTSLDRSRLEQLRVTAYDEGGGPQPDGEGEVTQVVQINVVNVNTQAERSIIDRQRWHYDREKGTWRLMTGLPDFSPH